METYTPISFLNDFIFCPRSIYFHQLYAGFHESVYKQTPQYYGMNSHKTIDGKYYTTSSNILQGLEVYSEQYNLCGKIDLFDIEKGRIIERKRSVNKIYDGYIFQVYAQCFALREMGYVVKEIVIYDMLHNKNYNILLPEHDSEVKEKFEFLLMEIFQFDLSSSEFEPLLSKCQNCIYSQLCDYSLC